MTLEAIATIAGMNILGIITPGPDFFLVTRLATRSRRHALAAVAGVSTGVIVLATLTVVGVAALLGRYPALTGIVEILGGVVLLLMGRAMILSGLRARRAHAAGKREPASALGSVAGAWRVGIATNLSNPKAMLFFAALIAPLVPEGLRPFDAVLLVLALWLPALVYFTIVATVISTQTVRRRLERAGWWIDLAAGAIFIVFSLTLIAEGLMSLR